MAIPKYFIDDLSQRADIAAVIGRHLELRPKGRELVGICPFHEDSKPSLAVNPDKGVYLCRACQAKGNALTFLQEYEGLDFVAAVEALAAIAGVEVPREDSGHGGPPRAELARYYDLLQRVSQDYSDRLRSPQGERGRAYLAGRGVSDELVERFQIGYAPGGWDFLERRYQRQAADLEAVGLLVRNEQRERVYDRFRDRIMFPIRDGRGRVVGFGGRILDSGEPKYLNSPETPVFQKRRELYGLHELRTRVRRPPRVLLVEGYMDVVGLASQGVDNSVAVLGTAATEQHFRTLVRAAPEVVCCFDGDAGGRGAAWRALETLLPLMNGTVQARFLFLPDGEDPDSFVRRQGAEGFDRALAAAVPLSRFFLDHLGAGLDMQSMDDRARFKAAADPLVAKLPAGAFADLMRQEVRAVAGLIRGQRRVSMRPAGPRPTTTSLAIKAIALAAHWPAVAQEYEPAVLERLARADVEHGAALARVLSVQRDNPGMDAGWLHGRLHGTADGVVLATALGLDLDSGSHGAEALRATIDQLTRDRVRAADVAGEGQPEDRMASFRKLLDERRRQSPGT